MKKYTIEEINSILNNLYGERYIVQKPHHAGSQEKYTLICKKHGEFKYRFDKLLAGNCECPICRKEREKKEHLENLLLRAKIIHEDKYDYSLINSEDFKNTTTKVPIICPKHGIFYQSLNNHINSKQGCQKCYNENRVGKTKINRDEYIKKAKITHNNFYSYENLVYKGIKRKVTITCPIHGDFEQVAYDHLRGFGCKMCKYEKNRDSVFDFIEKSRKVHRDKYDYSKVKYVNNHTKVTIICPIHGEFQQTPAAHILGCGCQKCHRSMLEEKVENFLKEKNIKYEWQKAFKWLGKQTLDFYLPEYNIAIECQGGQHFEPIDFGGDISKSEENFAKIIERDERKLKKCKENNIKIIYFTTTEYVKKQENLYDNLCELYENEIKKNVEL